jgi:hypothetical protein
MTFTERASRYGVPIVAGIVLLASAVACVPAPEAGGEPAYEPPPFAPYASDASPPSSPAIASGPSPSFRRVEGKACRGYNPNCFASEKVCSYDSTGCEVCSCNSPRSFYSGW